MQRRADAVASFAKFAIALLAAACVSVPAPSETSAPTLSQVPTVSTTTPPAPTDAPTDEPPELAGPLDWKLIGQVPQAVNLGLHGGSAGIFATGENADGSRAVWWSADGSTWARATFDTYGEIWDMAFDGSAGVAVGCTDCYTEDARKFTATAWSTSDGATWNAHVLPEHPAVIKNVVHWRGGYVAVGDWPEEEGPGDTCSGVAWRSRDGVNWNAPVTIEAGRCLGGFAATADRLVTESGPVWSSEDGRTWSKIVGERRAEDLGLDALIGGGPGLVAMRTECIYGIGMVRAICHNAVSTSASGTRWTAAAAIPALEDWRLRYRTFAALGDLIVAVGAVGDSENSSVATSRDGLTWERTELPLDSGAVGVAAAANHVYLLTYLGCVWAGSIR